MSAVPAMTFAAPAVTAQDLELEHAELLPARETLVVGIDPGGPMGPLRYPGPIQPIHPDPGGPDYPYPGPVRPW
jgi:hypothetical protein